MNRPFPQMSASFRSILLVFLAVDVAFILVHVGGAVLHRLGVTGDVAPILRISEDLSIPEWFNYLKWAILFVALTLIALRDRWLMPFAWALVFLLLLLDDSLEFHESSGIFIADFFQLKDERLLTQSDLGELIYATVIGVVITALFILALIRSDMKSRRLGLTYMVVLVALGFFGVVVDAMHRAVSALGDDLPGTGVLQDLFALLEEGGEMFVASVAVALTLAPPAWWTALPESQLLPARR